MLLSLPSIARYLCISVSKKGVRSTCVRKNLYQITVCKMSALPVETAPAGEMPCPTFARNTSSPCRQEREGRNANSTTNAVIAAHLYLLASSEESSSLADGKANSSESSLCWVESNELENRSLIILAKTRHETRSTVNLSTRSPYHAVATSARPGRCRCGQRPDRPLESPPTD